MNDQPEIISRKDARALGLKRYFTGKPCCNGHVSVRFPGGDCVECKRKHGQKWRENNLEKSRSASRTWDSKNPERRRANHQRYYEINQDKERASARSRGMAARAALRALRELGISL